MITGLLLLLVARTPKTLTVFAAASLKDAFTEIAKQYEVEHPDISIRLNFAGSQALAAQIQQGAPVDIFASASERNLLDAAPDRQTLRVFAENELTVVTRRGLTLKHGIKDLGGLPNIVLADVAVPAGHYAEEVLTNAAVVLGADWLAKVHAHVVSRELDVRAVLAKVVLGDADAGIVYVSDARSVHAGMNSIVIPPDWNILARYPVAVTSMSQDVPDSRDFIRFLFTPYAQGVFERDGFISPLRPVSHLAIVRNGTASPLSLPLRKLPMGTVVAGPDHRRYRGVLVSSLLQGTSSTNATFVGADDYAVTYSVQELKGSGAILFTTNGVDYQLIDPNSPPKGWVKWIRSIKFG